MNIIRLAKVIKNSLDSELIFRSVIEIRIAFVKCESLIISLY